MQLAIVNNVAVNTFVRTFLGTLTWIPLGALLGMVQLDHMAVYAKVFEKYPCLFPWKLD